MISRSGLLPEDAESPAGVVVERGARVRFQSGPGHPGLLSDQWPGQPDDWQGYPLRKNYGSGRIPVQFKNAPKVD